MYKHYTIALVAIGIICSLGVSAQSESKLQTKGETFLNKEMYEEALAYFSERDDKTKQENPLYNYYMAIVLYSMPERKNESIPFFEAYLEKSTPQQMAYYDHYHVYYQLGKMYHLNYRWDDAEEMYHQFLTQIHNAVDMLPLERKYPEYASVVSQDETKLIFTSRRPDTRGGQKSKEGGYYEDMYSATLIKGSLFEEQKTGATESHGSFFNTVTDFEYADFGRMNDEVNSTDHDGSIQLDRNDEVLYFYRDADIWSIDIGENADGAKAEKQSLKT